MAINRLEPARMDVFRGLRTLENPLDVPPGYSPDCQNVDFRAGTVFKRPGTSLVGTLTDAGTSVVSIKEYVGLDTADRELLLLTSDGELYRSDTDTYISPFTLIANSLYQQSLKSDMRMNSVTLFGREYLAFAVNGHASAIRPRQYGRGVSLDPVAPEGPGDPPAIADGAVDATNGLSAGVHKFRLFFRTRTGHWTTLSQPVSYTAPGGKLVNISQIAIGPEWVTERVIVATPEGSDDYFFIEGSKMVVGDNTAVSVTGLGWGSDSALISGTPVSSQTNPDEDLLRLAPLPAQAGVVAFRGRLGWWGERNTVVRANDKGFLNLSFNGGLIDPDVPCGWEEQIAGGTVVASMQDAVGTVFRITGDGVNQKGRIQNKIHALGVLPSGVSIRGRMRLKKSAGASQGTVHMYLVPLTTGAAVSGMSVDVGALSSSEWRLIDAEVISAAANLPNVDWVLRISSGGAPGGGTAISNGEWIAIDEVELYEAEDSVSKSLIRWSKVDEPESYDDLYGLQTVAENNGQDIRSCFVLRDTCFVVKERSTHAIRDNPDAEPADWGASEVSSTVGTFSPKGVGMGDGWVLIASRDGLYYFDGASFQDAPVSIEIQPTWARINWKYGHKIEVHVNADTGQVFVLAPLDGATEVSHVIYMRYLGGSPSNPQGRDWSLWPLVVNCAAFAERTSDRARSLYFGTPPFQFAGGPAKGNLLRLDADATDDNFGTDNPAAIDAYYQTHFLGREFGRRFFGYITMNIAGVGWLRLDAVRQDGSGIWSRKPLSPRYLDRFPLFDKEWIVSLTGERMAFRLGVQSLKEKFELRKMTVFQSESPWQKIRARTS